MRMPESSSPASTSPTAADPSPPSVEAAGQEPVSSAQSPAPSAEATGNGTGPKRSRRGRPGYDRETLINKATEVFVARGYDGTSMDTVARELGITKSAIYHHVKSKEELLHLAINRGIDALDSAVEAESHRTGITALERLRLAVRASVVILIEYHHSVTLLLRVRGNSPLRTRGPRGSAAMIDAKVRAWSSKAPSPRAVCVRTSLPASITRLLFGMVNSITEWYRPSYPVDPDTIAEAVTTMAFQGLEA
jgi:AcrR family transcriptional regulator